MNNNITNQNGDAMSGNEPTGVRRRRKSKVAIWLGIAGIFATSAALIPLGSNTQAAFAGESEGMVCTEGDSSTGHHVFNLTASDGYTSEPDGNAIYDWGYGDADKSLGFQLPGPVLCVQQGETVDVTLTNELLVDTSIQFPGQQGVSYYYGTDAPAPVGPTADGTGNLVSLVQQAGAPGGLSGIPSKITYSFIAGEAGTYLYESGSDPQLQVQMGLFGAIVVRPNVDITAADILAIPFEDGNASGQTNGNGGGMSSATAEALVADGRAACAYASLDDGNKCDPLAIYDSAADKENILMLSEIDPGVHNFMEQNLATPATLTWNSYPNGYEAHYFMINGRSMPDTVAPNNAPWMPSQPYGSLAHVKPWDPATNPLDALLRYVAVGVTGYDFHPHSNHEHVIAEDGALMKGTGTALDPGDDNTEAKFNIMVGPGSTVDATFRWTNEEQYSDTDGKRVPVAWPQGLNLQEGDFWSGSPYLGDSGLLNPGILTKTQCGEYYHVAHSHDLTQVTNYGITFGGMLTLIKVEPATGCD